MTASMNLWKKFKRAFDSRIVKRWGSKAAKESLWNQEFGKGQWDFLEQTVGDPIYPLLEKYSSGGSILDLGCGSGNTGNELDFAKYTNYTGVDISEIAIAKAIKRSKDNQREFRNEYACSDLESYVPKRQYDIILFRESIFYIPAAKIKSVLCRYAKYLSSTGVFIVRICDRDKHRSVVERIRDAFSVVEQQLVSNGKDILMVFKDR
jgi:SAM-dependent methyltransferase